jgi:flagellar motor switch protein FliG
VLTKCQSIRLAGPGLNPQEEREKRMAALLRSLERTERMETLQALEESDAALAGRIKAMLYLFEDILRMENASIQKLLSEIDMRSLAAALFGAEPTIRDRIVANLSRRAQESLKEEIELTGKVPAAKVKQARQMLEEAMQRLDQRGEFNMME